MYITKCEWSNKILKSLYGVVRHSNHPIFRFTNGLKRMVCLLLFYLENTNVGQLPTFVSPSRYYEFAA